MALDDKNLLNEAETFVKNWLTADTEVKANKVYEKIKETSLSVKDADYPAIGVYCNELNRNDDIITIGGVCVVMGSGVNNASDTSTKQICGQVMYSLEKRFVPGYNRASYAKDMGATRCVVEPIEAEGNSFRSTGMVWFELSVVSR